MWPSLLRLGSSLPSAHRWLSLCWASWFFFISSTTHFLGVGGGNSFYTSLNSSFFQSHTLKTAVSCDADLSSLCSFRCMCLSWRAHLPPWLPCSSVLTMSDLTLARPLSSCLAHRSAWRSPPLNAHGNLKRRMFRSRSLLLSVMMWSFS